MGFDELPDGFFVTLKPLFVLMIIWGWIKFTHGTKKPVGIIWNKTLLVSINYLVIIFCHFNTTGCFIHSTDLDPNGVKSTHGTKNNTWV